MQDVQSRFEKMFAHIAFGLKENLKRPNLEEYRYGLILRQGINMFSALAVEYSGMKGDELVNYLMSLNETEMICKKFTRPTNEWFSGWNESVLLDIQKCSFWDIGPIIYLNAQDKNYALTEECLDYLNATESDLSAIDEHIVFNLMKQLSQNNQEIYVYLRKFIIEHPLMTGIERKNLLLHFDNDQSIIELADKAYEDTPQDTYRCPNCGWTMTFKGLQPVCCHRDCREGVNVQKDKLQKIEPEYVYRLRKGVMRYICYPGNIELEIEDFCNKLNLKSELWPNFDQYDNKIIFANGTCWGIDAKTYSNPYFLSKKIAVDNIFQSASIDKGYYVIPDKIVKRTGGYLKICNKALAKNKKFSCITLSQLKRLIKKEIEK